MKRRLIGALWLIPLAVLYLTGQLFYVLFVILMLGYYEIIMNSRWLKHGCLAMIHMSGLLALTQMSEPVVWFNVLIVASNDIAAYIGGRYILPSGSPFQERIFPRTSPNKTVGGFTIGFFCSVLVGYFITLAFGWSSVWLLFSAVTALLAVAGDYYESLFKRRSLLKDSGQDLITAKLLPGHGGIYDRFDALAFSAPFVWLCQIIAL